MISSQVLLVMVELVKSLDLPREIGWGETPF